jgi:tungstate transport system permease protein
MNFIVEGFYAAVTLLCGFDPATYFILWTSLKVSISAVAAAALVGIPMGAFIALHRFPGKSALQVILNTLMAFPTVLIGLLLYAFLSRRGPLGELDLLYTPAGVALGLFTLAAPTMINLTVSAVLSLDPRAALTCRLLGAGPIRTACKVCNEARYAIMAAVVTAFGRVISEVGIAMMLGGNIKGFTRTMTTAIALETGKGEFALGIALGLLLLLTAFAVNALLYFLQRRSL